MREETMRPRVASIKTSSTVQLATRIPKSLHTRVVVDAIEHDMTVSEWVSDALAAYLERAIREIPAAVK
jgi:predicted HicB family RNase H-like nuclease